MGGLHANSHDMSQYDYSISCVQQLNYSVPGLGTQMQYHQTYMQFFFFDFSFQLKRSMTMILWSLTTLGTLRMKLILPMNQKVKVRLTLRQILNIVRVEVAKYL